MVRLRVARATGSVLHAPHDRAVRALATAARCHDQRGPRRLTKAGAGRGSRWARRPRTGCASQAARNSCQLPASALAAHLPPEIAALLRWVQEDEVEGVAAILYSGDRNMLAKLRQYVASQGNVIMPFIEVAAPSGHYPLYRLVCEHALSVNTTAAGGNTTLMSLAQ